MRSLVLFLVSFLVIIGFAGCGDNISMVKKGTLEFDKSIPIGQAFDKYKYFKKTEWKELVTDNGKKIVQVQGIIDLSLYPKDRSYFVNYFFTELYSALEKKDLKEVRIIVQFTINQDDTFKFSYYGVEATTIDGKEVSHNSSDRGVIAGLKDIYANDPMPTR